MHNGAIGIPVILCISVASGVIAGAYTMRYFGAYSWVRRYFTFWPTFLVVGVGVFFLCSLLFLLIFDEF